jgi:DNA polymerase-3 subunit delta'
VAKRAYDQPVEVLSELKLPPIPRWDAIIGQPTAIDLLQAVLASGHVHHAWIFHGPAGVGKFSTALAFAAALMDETTAPTLGGLIEPDPDSPTHRRLAAGAHPDLHIVRKELALYHEDRKVRERKLASIPLEVIRQHVLEPAHRAPAFASRAIAQKVFIIDEAELLDRSLTNAPVQNALLKTLEEPPAGTVIILVTSSEDRLLPTVRSRAQRVGFRSLADDEMRAAIAQHRFEVPPEHADFLLTFAQGSPGRLVEALQSKLATWHHEMEPILRQLRPGGSIFNLGPVADALIKHYATAWTDAGPNRSKEAANRVAARNILSILSQRIRPQLRDPHAADWASSAILRIEQAERDLASNVQPSLAFDALAADLTVRFA